MKKILPLLSGITLLAGVSTTNAGEPILLTTAQMDNVAAGVIATSTSYAIRTPTGSSGYAKACVDGVCSADGANPAQVTGPNGSYAHAKYVIRP